MVDDPMTNKIALQTLNTLTQDKFTSLLAEIYEHSSWIPKMAWHNRPFSSVENLHIKMLKVVVGASNIEKLKLLQFHPQLAGKEAKDGCLTEASNEEQASAKLNTLTTIEMKEITELNNAYMDTHQFPFIIAVKGHNKASIFEEFRQRLNNTTNDELNEAIWQVGLIAKFRLDALICE